MTWPVSAANRRTIRRILGLANAGRRFLYTAHIRPDGDALGSALALMGMLRRLGKQAHVVCDGGVAPALRFLPGASEVGSDPEDLRLPYDAAFVTDSASRTRLERIAAALPDDVPIVNIDHHLSNDCFGTINWVDPDYAATGEMVFDLVRAARVPIDRALAVPMYTAIATDTGRFSFSNTTERTHRMAAELLRHGVRPGEVHHALHRRKSPAELDLMALVLSARRTEAGGALVWAPLSRAMIRRVGIDPPETQEYIDALKSLDGVRMALLLREMPGGSAVKVSIRTEPGVDATQLARRWGGGGHPRAAGATVQGPLARVQRHIIGEAKRFLDSLRRRRSG